MTVVRGRNVIAIPTQYIDEFRRDPVGAMIRYGAVPQRAHQPYFTEVQTIIDMLALPDMVTGPKSEAQGEYRVLVAAPPRPGAEFPMLDGLSPHFRGDGESYWHVHVDLALHTDRRTDRDAAGIAMGRIAGSWEESATDGLGMTYRRIVRQFEVPLVAQIIAPLGAQVYIGSITQLILQLRQLRAFNISSFSFDGFQSAESMQQLALAGLVTSGMRVEDDGAVTGIPRPFSVDKQDMPYRELLESSNERRTTVARYELLRRELRQLEHEGPGKAPDHPLGGSKDCADPVAGVVGYLSAFGHASIQDPLLGRVFRREDFGLADPDDYLRVEDSEDWTFDPLGSDPIGFGVE